jgi:hypothetical protein
VIDHGGRTDNLGITLAGFRVASPLAAEYGSFFLSFAEEHHAFRLAEMPELFGHNIILALSLLKLNQGHIVLLGEALGRSHEALGHGVHQSRGGDRLTAVVTKESHHPAFPL